MENDRIRSLREEMGMATVKLDQVLTLPSHITHHIFGKERNTLIKSALKEISHTGKLIMAQPFLDPELQNSYQIRPELTILLNDKKNLPVYIPQEYLSERYAEYPNGHSFAEFSRHIPVPCVVKVSSSSSGNGVRICRTALELENVRKEYVAVSGTIIVEKMIEVARNFGIQFGIPFDPTMSMEIIGVSEQLTTPEGEFIGGIIDPQKVPPEIEHMQKVLLDRVLPIIRNMGWYGIGGFDVLIDTNGQSFITDPNFRMTGMTAYLCQVRNGSIRTPMMSFSGTFKGTEEEFRQHIMPLATEGASHQMLHVIALTRHEDMFYINAAMLFNPQKYSLQKNARQLTGLGLESRALRMLGTSRA
jgi:hypothetical protein